MSDDIVRLAKKQRELQRDMNRFVFKEYTFTFDPTKTNTFAISLKEKCFDVDFIKITLVLPENTANTVGLTPSNLQILFSDTPCNGHQFCITICAHGQNKSITFFHTNNTDSFGYSILTEVNNTIITNIILVSFLPPPVEEDMSINTNHLSSCWTFANGIFYLNSTGELNTPALH